MGSRVVWTNSRAFTNVVFKPLLQALTLWHGLRVRSLLIPSIAVSVSAQSTKSDQSFREKMRNVTITSSYLETFFLHIKMYFKNEWLWAIGRTSVQGIFVFLLSRLRLLFYINNSDQTKDVMTSKYSEDCKFTAFHLELMDKGKLSSGKKDGSM